MKTRWRKFHLLALALFAVAGIVYYIPLSPTPVNAPSAKERLRSELQLRESRLLDQGIPFTGIVVEYYGNGQLKSRSRVASGWLEGRSEGWYTNGALQVSEHFTKNVSHGLRTKHHENGAKLSEVNVVNGTLEGIYQRWHENGVLAERLCLTNGVPDGEAASYFPDGSLKARVRLDHGTVVEQQFAEQGKSL